MIITVIMMMMTIKIPKNNEMGGGELKKYYKCHFHNVLQVPFTRITVRLISEHRLVIGEQYFCAAAHYHQDVGIFCNEYLCSYTPR